MIAGSVAAELQKQRRRPVMGIVALVWLAMAAVFSFVIPYIVYKAGGGDASTATSSAELLANMIPDRLLGSILSLFPLFGGAMMLILGAMTAGGEYGWGTLSALYVQGPGRIVIHSAQLIALAVVLLGVVFATFLVMAACSALVASLEGAPLAWPTPGKAASALAATWLVAVVWAAFGFLLATFFRGTAPAIALGLVWVFAVETVLNGLGTVLQAVDTFQDWLPGASAGSLAIFFGASPQDDGGVPGVVSGTRPLHAMVVLLLYLAVFAISSGMIVRRRDAT